MSEQSHSDFSHSRGAVDLAGLPTTPGSATGAANGSAQPGGAGSWVVINADQATFQQVMQLSGQVPVLVHLATPSQPTSGQIDAVLAPAVDKRAGRMVMVQVDTEAQPQLLQVFGVPAGPLVVAVMGEQAVPLLNQPAPAEQIESVLDELNQMAVQSGMSGTVPPLTQPAGQDDERPALPPLHQAAEDALAGGDLAAAVQAYQQALAENPGDQAAQDGLSRVELIQRTQAMDAAAVRTTAADNPSDVQAQIDVADLDILGGHVEDALARLVRFIAAHPGEDRERARAHLVELYRVVGDQDPRVATSRRSLAMALF